MPGKLFAVAALLGSTLAPASLRAQDAQDLARRFGLPLVEPRPGLVPLTFEAGLLETLTPLAPKFVSVTYGAGGSTRERTHNTVARIARETPLAAAAHLTCVAASTDEIDDVARALAERECPLGRGAGVERLVAQRDQAEQGVLARHPEQGGGQQRAADGHRAGRARLAGAAHRGGPGRRASS